MTSKHTPGPWDVWEGNLKVFSGVTSNSHGCLRQKPDGVQICEVGDGFDEEDDPVLQANARLIAAAPDLLEACRTVLEWWETDNATRREMLDAARDAIAKATGGGE